MQAYLSSNNLANDFRSDTKESDTMEVDCKETLSVAKKQKRQKKTRRGKMAKRQRQGPAQRQRRRREARRTTQMMLRVWKKKGHFAQDYFSRIHLDKTVNELEGARMAANAAKKKCTRMKSQ